MGFPKAGVRMSILKASYYPKCIEWFYWEGSLGGADAKVFGIWFPISFGTCSASFCFTRSSEACSIRLSNRADMLQGNDSLWWTAVPTKTRQFQGLHPYVQGDNKIQSWQWNTMNNWDFKHLHKHQPFSHVSLPASQRPLLCQDTVALPGMEVQPVPLHHPGSIKWSLKSISSQSWNGRRPVIGKSWSN